MSALRTYSAYVGGKVWNGAKMPPVDTAHSSPAGTRVHERRETCSIGVLVDQEDFEIRDISLNGLMLKDCPKCAVEGDDLKFFLVVYVEGNRSHIPCDGVVVRRNDKGLAVQYEAPHPRWVDILPYHLARYG